MRVLMLGGPYHGDMRAVRDGEYAILYAEARRSCWDAPAVQELAFTPKKYRVERMAFSFSPSGTLYRGRVAFAEAMTPGERDAITFRTLIAPQYQGVFEKW